MMPFGLRNAGATYQRPVDKAFHKQIGRNLKVYVDDLVIKIRTEDEIVKDIEETFNTLREINMKLNPKKCTFGVEEGMFLGYKVNTKGLKKSDFHWTAEAEEAFKQMKQLIAELPMLTTPMEKEELIVYLAAAKETVSTVLMTEREAKQMPIYFVSRALRGPELNYTSMEKLVHWLLSTCVFDAINNEAEYEALIAGLRIAKQMGVKNLQANVDSRLVANQVNGTYVTKETDMIHYLEKWRIKENTWIDPISNTLAKAITYQRVKKARAIRLCIGPLQANYVPREIHEGSCSMHADQWPRRKSKSQLRRRNKSKVGYEQRSERAATALDGYRCELSIPPKIGMPTLRTVEVDLGQNNEALEINLDLLEERRGEAAIREAKSKAKMEKYYN
ncbi:reverse transcriptase domain-containing protein [Tanacetum coccineum]|uniref:Reverse transcriptase domain-containing protein n=1 Tax=Tanacetum coccineum TaxID=301880 RepID=A0ABQ4WAW9_9ASTR